ncbi:unnamed protein product, partial [Discosporangium mesarthrocarpum]
TEESEDQDGGLLETAFDAVESIIDGLPDAVVVHRDGELLYLNPYAATLMGYAEPQDALTLHTVDALFGAYSQDLMMPDGESVTFTGTPYESGAVRISARARTIQWPDGAAVQIILKPADEELEDDQELGLPKNVVRLV